MTSCAPCGFLAALAALAVLAPTSALRAQDYTLAPTNGAVSLAQGFQPDPHLVKLEAGGPNARALTDSTSGVVCDGFFTDAPGLRMFYDTRGGQALSISARSDDDTMLLINAPDGSWHCNDDFRGLDPAVTFQAPLAGQYDIWAGTYSHPGADLPWAEIRISGGAPFGGDAAGTGGQAQSGAEPETLSAVTVASGFLPDPIVLDLLAGGANIASYTDATSGDECEGFFSTAPGARVVYEGAAGPALSFASESDDDTVMAVSAPDGTWHCNDDTWGLNSAVTFATPMPGQYEIWVGTYSSPDAQLPRAELSITEGEPFRSQIDRSFFGADDRVVMDPTASPWSMIGLVEMTEGSCTGVLVGPSIVLTAAHCFANLGEDDSPPVAFYAGYQNETSVAEAGITGYHMLDSWTANEQEGTDFAFMFLDTPIGEQLGWMTVGPLTPAELDAFDLGNGPTILQAGYSADQPEVLTGNLDCAFMQLGAMNTLIHQCDTLVGDSGSPLFIRDGNGYRVIAVESYTDELPDQEFDLNVAMYAQDVLVEMRALPAARLR